MAENYYYGTGRRKSAVARVFMKRGSGNIVVNGKPIDEFFSRVTGRMIVLRPARQFGEGLWTRRRRARLARRRAWRLGTRRGRRHRLRRHAGREGQRQHQGRNELQLAQMAAKPLRHASRNQDRPRD